MWATLTDLVETQADCPACGEPVLAPHAVDGYRRLHCRRCAQAIARRQHHREEAPA